MNTPTQHPVTRVAGPALKPCPFCGEQEHLYPGYRWKNSWSTELEPRPYCIDCVGCGFEFVPREGCDVIAMWNRRTHSGDAP